MEYPAHTILYGRHARELEMNAEQFVYWLNGYLELSGAQDLNAAQVKSVREHLALVLGKVTPPLENPSIYFRPGVKCSVCQSMCSNEGGVCNKCQSVPVSSGGADLSHLPDSAEVLDILEAPIVDVPCWLTC